ncbi:hypothetical protein BJY01DRAFT_247138 [Aspergillus pseudoustus]|uniref:Nephrocystin 3-like N-terminal domain-containing protein n=1 Tax=Aspergillus pseudoustus TaxID=1810923 RepID=A0ABR4K300_9EURO
MEAAGVMNEIPRGVCDYGDERKNKDWQQYAAAMAATFAKAVLSEITPKPATQLASVRTGFTDEDSFQWVLSNAEFQRWRSDHQCQLLWIKGNPGKGKTMLMIGIINELLQQIQSQPSQSMAYFLCQATDPRLNNATSILRSLIYMLI